MKTQIQKRKWFKILAILFLIGSIGNLLSVISPILVLLIIGFIVFKIYEFFYFRSKKFNEVKSEISSYIQECNELNGHIESLRSIDSTFERKDYGDAIIKDNSKYNYKRKNWDKYSKSKYVHNCSNTVCKNAQERPFEYITKYFNIPKTEESLNKFEEVLNNFLSVEEGRNYLTLKEKTLISDTKEKLPWLIRHLSTKNKLSEKLGFEPVDLSDVHFPSYKFQYVSPGGNSSMEAEVIMDTDNLERFIDFLDSHIKWQNSARGQRALMTPKLRETIKERDNYTCCNCGNGLHKEPNLLLEIDHIMPISKGGKTTEDNLQTLCWKCNRSKGSKVVS